MIIGSPPAVSGRRAVTTVPGRRTGPGSTMCRPAPSARSASIAGRRPGAGRGSETSAVVGDLDHELLVVGSDLTPSMRSAAVAGGVGHRLDGDAVGRRLHRRRQPGAGPRRRRRRRGHRQRCAARERRAPSKPSSSSAGGRSPSTSGGCPPSPAFTSVSISPSSAYADELSATSRRASPAFRPIAASAGPESVVQVATQPPTLVLPRGPPPRPGTAAGPGAVVRPGPPVRPDGQRRRAG